MASGAREILGFDIDRAEVALRNHGAGLPPHTYTSNSIFDLEQREIFGKSWNCFAPLHKLSESGSVVVGNVGRTPIVVTRARDGTLHGFINVCRHRGYPVAEGDLSGCKKLTCRYHTWTYALDGTLVAAPDSPEDFDKLQNGLLPVSVETWGAFVFVCPTPNAPPLREAYHRIDELAERLKLNLSPTSYDLIDTTTSEQNANWKLWWDNATECYHCRTIHASSFGDFFGTSAEEYSFEPAGMMTATSVAASSDDPTAKPASTFHLFPSAHIVQQDDIMIMARISPSAHDRYSIETYYFAETGADRQRVEHWLKIWKQTYEEDKAAVQLQQVGLESGRTKPFNYVAAREQQPMHHMLNVLSAYRAASADARAPREVCRKGQDGK